MDVEATVTRGFKATDAMARYDASCKRLLSEKAILVRIMKGCLKEYKDCDAADIAERYIEGQPQAADVPVHPDGEGSMITGMDTEDKAVREGTVTYDIRFCALVPDANEWVALIINVEA